MAEDYRRKIESEMDRFEAEISSLSRPPGPPGPPSVTPSFIPAQLRRHPSPAVIAAAPVINKPPQVMLSGAPQVYRSPAIRSRMPMPHSTTTTIQRGMRPLLRPPPGPVVVSALPTMFSARPTITSPPVVTGLPVPAQPGFPNVPIGIGMPMGGVITGAPLLPTPVASIPLPAEQSSSDPKASTSTSESNETNEKGNGKKKKEKKPRKNIRCAGGTVWEDQSLQDWDTNDYRLFCGDLGNDVTDEVLTRVFGRYPSFQKARVIRDKRTNKTKGYGFVSFKDSNDFARAVKEVDGRYVGSRPIKLRKSTWKSRDVGVVRKRETERLQLLGINKKPKLY